DDTVGLVLLLGPHDRRAAALQRQTRKRPRREEMLLGAALMVPLVCDGGDDGGLRIVPAEALDAGGTPNRRARSIGRDQKLRGKYFASGEAHFHAFRPGVETRHRVGAQRNTAPLRLLDQRRDQRRVLDHVSERLAGRDLALEAEIFWPHRIL